MTRRQTIDKNKWQTSRNPIISTPSQFFSLHSAAVIHLVPCYDAIKLEVVATRSGRTIINVFMRLCVYRVHNYVCVWERARLSLLSGSGWRVAVGWMNHPPWKRIYPGVAEVPAGRQQKKKRGFFSIPPMTNFCCHKHSKK